MKKVRFGIIGLGNMGPGHARKCATDGGRDLSLGAVCDVVEDKARKIGEELGVPYFTDAGEMIDSGLCDAVIIAVPHYWHAALTVRAAQAGLHVISEKPLSSLVGQARAMIAECKKRKVVLGCMLQHRARSVMIKARQIVQSGRLGELYRVQLICATWMRTQKYFDSGAWRGTWDGEGGGVLMNQAPHHLDLFQWIGGMPTRVTAILGTRAHKIEVEDSADIVMEYPKGKVGYLYTSTADEPGYEQFVISGDKGTMVVENDEIKIAKLRIPVRKHIMTSKRAMGAGKEQKVTWTTVKHAGKKGGHLAVIRAFAAHLLRKKPLLATGDQAIGGLEICNAAYISGYKNKSVDLPLDSQEMDRLMAKLERDRSTGRGGDLRKTGIAALNKLLRKK